MKKNMYGYCLAACTVAVLSALGVPAKADIVIANNSLEINKIDAATLKSVYLGKSTSLSNGKNVTFATLGGGKAHEQFLDRYVSLTPQQYSSYWLKLVFSGKGRQPAAFSSDEDLVAYVARTPGAIGYIGDASQAKGVTIVSVVRKR